MFFNENSFDSITIHTYCNNLSTEIEDYFSGKNSKNKKITTFSC